MKLHIQVWMRNSSCFPFPLTLLITFSQIPRDALTLQLVSRNLNRKVFSNSVIYISIFTSFNCFALFFFLLYLNSLPFVPCPVCSKVANSILLRSTIYLVKLPFGSPLKKNSRNTVYVKVTYEISSEINRYEEYVRYRSGRHPVFLFDWNGIRR